MSKALELSIKASTGIEGYFSHRCERNFLYGALKESDRSPLGLNKPDVTGGVVAAKAGEEWELEVLEHRIPKDLCVSKMTGKKYGKFDVSETKDHLTKLSNLTSKDHKSRYIYQGQLEETESFRKKYFNFDSRFHDGSDENLQVHIARTYPDFIRISWNDDLNKTVISIVDCKLAANMQLKHKAQITLYSVLLKCMLDEWHDKGELNEAVADPENGYLWNRDHETEEPFLLNSTMVLLDDFFDGVLPKTVIKFAELLKEGKDYKDRKDESILDTMDVCVSQTCEWCENYRQCRKVLEKKGSIALLPYLSGYAQVHAKDIGAPDTLNGMSVYIEDEDNTARLRGNRSWDLLLQDGTLMEVHKNAFPYTKEKIYGDADSPKYMWKKNARSFTLPKGQNVSVFLTAQKDVGTGRVCILGWHKSEWIHTEDNNDGAETEQADLPDDENVSEEGESRNTGNTGWRVDETCRTYIAKDPSESAYIENATSFVNELLQELEGMQDKNAQTYVFDSYEKKNLEDLLYDLIERDEAGDETRSCAMRILLWIQGDRIITDSDVQPDKEIDSPVIILISQIRHLLSMPIPIAYNLRGVRNVLGAFVKKEDMFDKEDSPFFEAISDAVKSEVINDYWNRKKDKDGKLLFTEELIKKHIRKRFVYAQAVLQKVQSEGRRNGALVSNTYSLKLPEPLTLHPVILSKWIFENRNEELLQYRGIRSSRMQDLESALHDGSIIRAELTEIQDVEDEKSGYTNKHYYFKISDMGEFRAQRWFSALMVSEEAPDDMYRFPDYHYSSLFPYLNGELDVSVLNFLEWEYKDGFYYLDANVKRASGEVGKTYLLSERYADVNSTKVSNVIRKLNYFTRRGLDLVDADRLCHNTGDCYEHDKNKLGKYSRIGDTDFTDSQKKAFQHLYENTLTVLQGPPGTGKTDFIARAVITICRFYKEKDGRNLRVFITANSHAAIENALFGVSAKLAGADDIEVVKAEKFDDGSANAKNGVAVYSDKAIADCFEEGRGLDCPTVVGATNWDIYKMAYKDEEKESLFDLIIIDEASQVRVMDAMIGMSMAADGARFLLVGDDDQLPPIIQGKYKKEPGVPYDYGSVFRYYSDRAGDAGYKLMLGEDFRMNEILLRYSAEKIYSSEYKAFNDEVRARHLDYHRSDEAFPKWINYSLDGLEYKENDYWPLIFFKISGGTADEQAELECRLVTEMTCALRKTIGADVSDKNFWLENADADSDDEASGLFGIISPHHKHIEKLKNSISESSGMNRDDLYIGTVDKLQGQERDAVIVSYGVTDLEQASVEGEFLFSRNRLNVSLTRGKCKTIVFFSEVLTRCPIELCSSDDEDIQKGADFVCGLYDFMKRSESDTEISSESFEFEINGDRLTVEICRKRCTR